MAVDESYGTQLRAAAFEHLTRLLDSAAGGALASADINRFEFRGRRTPLVVQSGIWNLLHQGYGRRAAVAARANAETHGGQARSGSVPVRSGWSVGAEPGAYTRDPNGPSLVRDVVVSATRGNDPDAAERLARHQAETRALSTGAGAGGECVPPAWLVNEYVKSGPSGPRHG